MDLQYESMELQSKQQRWTTRAPNTTEEERKKELNWKAKARSKARKAARREYQRYQNLAEDLENDQHKSTLEKSRRNGLDEVDIMTSPLLYYLLGAGFEALSRKDLVDKILSSIQDYLSSSKGMFIRGRTTDMFRIHYDPTCSKTFGIKFRLTTALTPSIDYSKLNDLLSPFVVSNPKAFHLSHSSEFEKLVSSPGVPKLNPRSFTSHWSLTPGLLDYLRPLTWLRRYNIASAVLHAIRQRCFEVSPASNLLRDPYALDVEEESELRRIRAWSLCGVQIGLALKLRECFKNRMLSSLEYEDLVEQVLYCFKQANETEFADWVPISDVDSHLDFNAVMDMGKAIRAKLEASDQESGGIDGRDRREEVSGEDIDIDNREQWHAEEEGKEDWLIEFSDDE